MSNFTQTVDINLDDVRHRQAMDRFDVWSMLIYGKHAVLNPLSDSQQILLIGMVTEGSGGLSEPSKADCQVLEKRQYISNHENGWVVTSVGVKLVDLMVNQPAV